MPDQITKKFNSVKWMALVALVVFLVFGTGFIYFELRIKPLIEQELRELVPRSTEGLYHLDFTGLSINLLTANASLSNVKLIPDPIVLEKLRLLKKAPNNVYHIELRKLSALNFHLFRMFKDKKLNIDEIEINRPMITMVNRQMDYNENRAPRPLKSPYDYISKVLKELSVDTVNFREAAFKYVDNNKAKPIIDSIANLNVTLADWLIDKDSARDTTRMYLLKDIMLNLDDYSYATPDSLYNIHLSEMNFKASTGLLHIDKFELLPRYSEMQFGQKVGYAKDRYSIRMNDLQLAGINLPLYIKKQELFARQMSIGDGAVSVFNNNELEKPKEPKTGKYPHQLLQKVGSKITIQKLDLYHLNIAYAEFDRNSKQKGKITFENTSGTITNITNAPAAKQKNKFMVADLTTYMMGQGKLDTKFTFDLLAEDGAFAYSGLLHGLNGPAMNAVTKPLGMVHIKSGVVDELSFDLKADEHGASGSMVFKYHDLAIAVLKREAGTVWLIRQGFLSFLANNLIINPQNPSKEGILSKAVIDYKRAPDRSFFNLIWKSLFQGIKYSVGVTPQKEAQIKAQVARFEKMKTERDKRRANRQKRRAQRKQEHN
ncbi:hypothetical protein DBR11_08310 [Pedobacter sp. HMWF019]|uniref:hypothetical protein n=1 Tax=Pedobacter sp. HMWF019 TaxID=2056856 RepID=UPI000D33C7B7|nr:hypothetical protein [Pedobacter sp. HMWF019]PTT01030.1 hypothetical protein DBR11_08310 [Pedobacter sp. HMWF019]